MSLVGQRVISKQISQIMGLTQNGSGCVKSPCCISINAAPAGTIFRQPRVNQDLRKIVLARRADEDSTKIVRQGGTTQPGQLCVGHISESS